MTDPNMRVESALTDLEGILYALDLIRFEGALNKPGPECHALAVLAHLAVEQVAKLRSAIYPGDASAPEQPCSGEAAPC